MQSSQLCNLLCKIWEFSLKQFFEIWHFGTLFSPKSFAWLHSFILFYCVLDQVAKIHPQNNIGTRRQLSCNWVPSIGCCFTWANSKLDILKCKVEYPSNTLANSTLILLFSEMLKISKIISSKSNILWRINSEDWGIFHFVEWSFQN
jgi:hypothetical protein